MTSVLILQGQIQKNVKTQENDRYSKQANETEKKVKTIYLKLKLLQEVYIKLRLLIAFLNHKHTKKKNEKKYIEILS